MVASYIRLSSSATDLIAIYETEIGHTTPQAREELRNQQRITVDEFATWLTRVRDELSLSQARFLVHASLNVVTDLSRQSLPPSPDRIDALAMRILLHG